MSKPPGIDSEHLAWAMNKGGWRPAKFAEAVGISPQYLSDILAGRSKLGRSPDLITKMADVLNIPRSMIEAKLEVEAAS